MPFCLDSEVTILHNGWKDKKCTKMGTVKDRNRMDLTETEDIKKRWQEYTEELYKKDLYDPDNHDGVIITPPRARSPT